MNNIVDVIPIPSCTKELVTKSDNEDILDHFLAQIVVNPENLIFMPVWTQCALELPRAWKIFAEWFLDLYTYAIS